MLIPFGDLQSKLCKLIKHSAEVSSWRPEPILYICFTCFDIMLDQQLLYIELRDMYQIAYDYIKFQYSNPPTLMVPQWIAGYIQH